jgi:hypothetical protein
MPLPKRQKVSSQPTYTLVESASEDEQEGGKEEEEEEEQTFA